MGPTIRRRTKFGPVLLALVGVVAVIAAPLGATGSSNVEPKYVAGSAACAAGTAYSLTIGSINESQLAGAWTAGSPGVQAAPSGPWWNGVAFTISGVSTGDHTFSWAASRNGSPLKVASVTVKGGTGANVYD